MRNQVLIVVCAVVVLIGGSGCQGVTPLPSPAKVVTATGSVPLITPERETPSPSATQPPASPTVPTETVWPSATNTVLAIQPSATLLQPTSTVRPTVESEVERSLQRGYLTLILLDGCAIMVEETAQQLQSGDMDDLEGFGALIALAAVLTPVDEVLGEPAPVAILEPAWGEARIALSLLKRVVKSWFGKEIMAKGVLDQLRPVRRQIDLTLQTAEKALAEEYGILQDAMQHWREDGMAELRAAMAATPAPAGTRIARTTPAPTTVPTAAPTPLRRPTITVQEPLSLEALFYATDWFTPYLIGVVKNSGTRAVAGADIKMVYYRGKIIVEEGGDSTKPSMGVIEPGEKAPFSIYLPDEEWESCKMLIEPRTNAARYYHNPSLKLASHGLTMGGDIRGEIHNTGKTPVEDIHIAVTGYDGQGNLVAVASGTTKADTVPAGEGSLFEIGFWDGDSSKVETYELRILSRVD